MRRVIRIVVGVFAAIGAAYAAFAVYALFFLPVCQYVVAAQARSPNQRYNAIFSQTTCEDSTKSHSSVQMSVVDGKDTIALLDVQGTSDVVLTWNGDSELQVALPKSAVTKRYTAQNGWPRVIEIRVSKP